MRAITFTLAVAFLLVFVSLSAQEKENTGTVKHSIIGEIGMVAAGPRGVGIEATVINGVSFNKQHLVGLGIGFGNNFYSIRHSTPYSTTITSSSAVYTPIYINYRYYFKPEKTFSPHINVAAGGLWIENGEGLFSSLTMGFRVGFFSFSSGLSFMAIHQKEGMKFEEYYDPSTNTFYSYSLPESVWLWRYPFGITLKVGFTF